MTTPGRAAKRRRGSRRPGWALLTALLVLAIGSGIALVFFDKPVYLKVAVVLALWAAVAASFMALNYRRQSDADQAKVRDQKLVYDLQLEREISARREYELSVESRLRQQLAAEVEAQAADEIATLRAELAALRTNLEVLFNADLSARPALEHDPVQALGPWPGAEPEPVASAAAQSMAAPFAHTVRDSAARADYEDVTAEEEDSHTTENPIIDVAAEPHHPYVEEGADVEVEVEEDESVDTPPYPSPAAFYGATQHEPEPYRQPASSGSHWRPEPEPQPHQPAAQAWSAGPDAVLPDLTPAWSARAEDWDAAADGEDWDPVAEPMAPPPGLFGQPTARVPLEPEWNLGPMQSEWIPAPSEGQWSPPQPAGRHSGTSSRHQAPVPPEAAPVSGLWSSGLTTSESPAPQPPTGGRRRAPEVEPEEPKGRRRVEETGGHSVADLLGRLQPNSDEPSGGRRRRRED